MRSLIPFTPPPLRPLAPSSSPCFRCASCTCNTRRQEHILDLGCGSGDLTLSALLPAVAPSGSILGVDSSPNLLAKAQSNTSSASLSPEAAKAISWVECDGQELGQIGREGEFDAVFTNAALHWMKRDPAAVVKGVYGVLKQGGRFVGEVSLLSRFPVPSLLLHSSSGPPEL